MTTQEKLQKSLDVLMALTTIQPPEQAKKKEKIHHCYVISEACSNPTIKVSKSFPMLLGVSIEIFLKLCDDTDADVRMTSDECLNRIMQAAIDGHLGTIQAALHKEIKKNGSSKSLRAALMRFSELSHHIRPHIGKVYVAKLFPSLIRITERAEEAVHETLATNFPKLLKSLGVFSPDNEIKALLESFLQNIVKPSATIRRTSSNCILSICVNSRRPHYFFTYCLNYLLDILTPLDINQSAWAILGVLYCLKVLLAELKNVDGNGSSTEFQSIDHIPVNKLLGIYELCIYYLSNKDHNIVNASLDTLTVLLRNAPDDLQAKLGNSNGFSSSRIHKSMSITSTRSSKCKLTETIDSDIEHCSVESRLSVLDLDDIILRDSVECVTDQSTVTEVNFLKHSTSFQRNNKSSNGSDQLDELKEQVSEYSSESTHIFPIEKDELCEVDIGSYLDKSIPLLYCTRLIVKLYLLTGVPGKCIGDKTSRVSVKSSALKCLSAIFRLYPNAFFEYLDKNYEEGNAESSGQRIEDIKLFSTHPDPQIRGLIRMLISDIMFTILSKSKLDYGLWLQNLPKRRLDALLPSSDTMLKLNNFIEIWLQGLQDQNSTCLRQTLLCLKPVLKLLAESSSCKDILPILNELPLLANNPYWLVKVALCELVSTLSYLTIYHITGNCIFQQKVLHNILFYLLKDSDQRIRNAASKAIQEIIKHLYSEEYHSKEDPITTKGIYSVSEHISCLRDKPLHQNLYYTHFVEDMPFPYSQISAIACGRVDYCLSKIVMKLYVNMLETDSKSCIYGCIQALSDLACTYPCTVYRMGWDITNRVRETDGNIKDLLSLCVSLLNSSVHIYDITFLVNLINLTLNLYAGYAIVCLKPIDLTEKPLGAWPMFLNETFKTISDQYLLHIMRLLNIFHHVINELVPVSAQNKTVLPHLPSTGTLSPIKRRKSEDKKMPVGYTRSPPEKDDKIDRKEVKNIGFGYFACSQHYMKIFELLKNAYLNYKMCIDPATSDSFVELMRKTIHTLCVILEVGSLNEFGKLSEEILTYLKTTFYLDKTLTVQCVQQLVKCLFGINLTANLGDILDVTTKENKENDYSFYYNMIQKPAQKVSSCIQSLITISKVECDGDNTLMGYLHRKDVKKPVAIARASDKILASYIPIFEPIVINSLKHYTVTSDVIFQTCVLKLLTQLVQARVNYCLLDSEQVFKDSVLKQFEYIEEGLIPYPEKNIPNIFKFLVHLSYAKQHNKSIVDVPKIIQLCDGLMASGQDPETHCIPSLKPIVEDVFLFRSRSNTKDMKELETTREVILSMLLRLLEYREVIDLVTIILEESKYCTDDTEKWLRLSEQVGNVLLHALQQDKIRISEEETVISLRKLIAALNPNVFKDMDDVIMMLFQDPRSLGNGHLFSRWISKVIILFFLMSSLKEDKLLSKIDSIKDKFCPGSIFDNFTATSDPLNVYCNTSPFQDMPAENIVATLIFRIIYLTIRVIANSDLKSNPFLISQFSTFLMYCSHIFQSGILCKISQAAAAILHLSPSEVNSDELNELFGSVKRVHPVLTFQWCHLLSLLNYQSLEFWKTILNSKDDSINICLVKNGGVIVYCDLLNENVSENATLWIIHAHCEILVSLVDESPVSAFISFVHRDSTLSGFFVENISQQCMDNENPLFKTKVLKCLESCHTSQTSIVLKLLISKMLSNRQILISRIVAQLACRKIEYIFSNPSEEILAGLSRNDLLNYLMLAKKHETLIGLLNKLLIRYYDMSPDALCESSVSSIVDIRKIDINQNWLLSNIGIKSQDDILRKETALVLDSLEYEEISEFMSSNSFNKIIFRDCIETAVRILEDGGCEEEPALLKAAVDNILKGISTILKGICDNHKDGSLSVESTSYVPRMINAFKEESFSTLHDLSISVSSLIRHLPQLPTLQLSEIDCENISKFAVVCLECISFLFATGGKNLKLNYLEVFMESSNEILKNSQFSSHLGVDENLPWLCSAINALYSIMEYVLKDDEPLPSIERNLLQCSSDDNDIKQAQTACYYMYILTCWLYKNASRFFKIPRFVLYRIRSLIISLARLPLVNSYNFVPYRVWKLGWEPKLTGKFLTQIPPLPIDMLQEIDVLEEYVFRTSILGWTTRQQFEETWMCMLSVLCTPLDNVDLTDINIARRASTLAMKAITDQLLQTLRYPVLGNKNVSKLIHVSRNRQFPDTTISMKKLRVIQYHIERKYKEVCNTYTKGHIRNVFSIKNFEKSGDHYSYGQLSIRYFLISANVIEENGLETDKMYRKRLELLDDSGLDLNSCLQFLLEYYSQLMKPESTITDIRILHETVRSTVFISDLFTDKAQFAWMLKVFLELMNIHGVEDELIHQYLIVGICKAVGVLNPDIDIYEQTKKMLVQFLKSPFLPTRISCLYGLLYILEGCVLSNIAIGRVSEELQILLPCAWEYIQMNINTDHPILQQSQEHTLLVWSLAFYLMENVDEAHLESNFVTSTLQAALARVRKKQVNYVDKCIIKELEMMLIIKPMYMLETVGKDLQKLALEKLKDEDTSISVLGIQLLVTYMYVDCWEHLDRTDVECEQTSPDHLVQTIEKISAIFECIKKSHVSEVEVLSSILPLILRDFFSPSDILTKVIGEFLSPQQPHPKLMSGVVFKVFDSAIQLNQLPLLQDWVVFSLSNFTKSFSNMATWCLTCFFISASPNKWLKAYFPYVQNRVGRYDYEDKKIFCIAGADFYKHLTNCHQRKSFVDSFMRVKDEKDMPFNDLLNSI
uniref:Huntingtin n=1 Tax=Dendroctonus ponderosae TaxID=77166 RepID=A0AAR5QD03_DENPD